MEMNCIANKDKAHRLVLSASAGDLMTANPQSLRDKATFDEATSFLNSRGFSGAPVINDAGRPVGFVSKTDLLRHALRSSSKPTNAPAGHDGASLMCNAARGHHGEHCQCPALVRQFMTPAIVAVPQSTPMAQVVEKMLARGVQRVLVIDKTGALIGVVSARDILRALCARPENGFARGQHLRSNRHSKSVGIHES
jgi:CBS domain-containing protein